MSELLIEPILFTSAVTGVVFCKMCEAFSLLFKEIERINKIMRVNDKVCDRKVII